MPILSVTLLALVPLAYASPPDAVWISGSYDGSDLDEVVLAATSIPSAGAGQKVTPRGDTVSLVVGMPLPLKPATCSRALSSEEPRVLQSVSLSADVTRSPPAP